MYLTVSREREYISKGYMYYKRFDRDYDAAKECAASLRRTGSKAFVAEYGTNIKGYHTFAVWYK